MNSTSQHIRPGSLPRIFPLPVSPAANIVVTLWSFWYKSLPHWKDQLMTVPC